MGIKQSKKTKRTTKPSNGKPFSIFAVKFADKNGWVIYRANQTMGTVKKTFPITHPNVEKIKEISTGIDYQDQPSESEGNNLLSEEYFLVDFNDEFLVWEWGWFYDASVGVWRDTDESILEPATQPQAISQFDFGIDNPNHGWLPMYMRFDSSQVDLEGSDVYDPIPTCLKWMENIVRNIPSRWNVNEEGSLHIFHAFPKGDHLVRIVVHLIPKSYDILLDVVVNKYSFLNTIYRELQEVEKNPLLNKHWLSDEMERDMMKPPFKNAAIEEYIQKNA